MSVAGLPRRERDDSTEEVAATWSVSGIHLETRDLHSTLTIGDAKKLLASLAVAIEEYEATS